MASKQNSVILILFAAHFTERPLYYYSWTNAFTFCSSSSNTTNLAG